MTSSSTRSDDLDAGDLLGREGKRIAYASIYDATDVSKWRRGGYFMARALGSAGAAVTCLGPLSQRGRWLTKPKAAWYNRAVNRSPYRAYYPGRDRFVVKGWGEELGRRLRGVDAEVVVSGESPFSQPVAYLETDLPVVIWTDATFAGVLGFYPSYSHLCAATIRDGMANEASALARADLVVFSSPWAADAAMAVYGLHAGKVKVANYGPGPMLPVSEQQATDMVERRSRIPLRLLFVGENWQRKGGDIAVALLQGLRRRGVPAELLLLGCSPPEGTLLPEGVRVLGWVDKRTQAGQWKFRELMASAHLLVLPTRADCTPMVVCEAAAHGVPSLTSDVGGLPWMVEEGRNGRTVPLEADVDTWVEAALQMSDPAVYDELAVGSYREYHDRLNWDVHGRSVVKWISQRSPVSG